MVRRARPALALAAALLAIGSAAARLPSPAPVDAGAVAGTGGDARIILLGTAGGPRVRADRSQPATALVIEGRVYLFDIGYGTLNRLAEAGLALDAIEAVFITHNHFDHNADLGPLFAFSWHAGRRTPLRIFGPPGTRAVAEQALGAFGRSIEIFNSEAPRAAPELGRDIRVVEAEPDAAVFSDERVRVRNAENAHFVHIRPDSPAHGRDKSYSYRIETGTGSVVISGDTGPGDGLAGLAGGADVLVSEVLDEEAVRQYVAAWAARDGLGETTASEALAHMLDGHLAASALARLASDAAVCRLVLTHLVPSGSGDMTRVAAAIGAGFDGEVVAGEDLLSVPVDCRRTGE